MRAEFSYNWAYQQTTIAGKFTQSKYFMMMKQKKVLKIVTHQTRNKFHTSQQFRVKIFRSGSAGSFKVCIVHGGLVRLFNANFTFTFLYLMSEMLSFGGNFVFY